MNQRTHSWIAIRAIALLADEDKALNRRSGLVRLLKPHAGMATVGAWIPDQTDARRAGGRVDNHVLKIEPYCGKDNVERFIARKDVLLKRVGARRKLGRLVKADSSLPKTWWAQPYKGDVKKAGQHLPNRAMSMTTMMKDLLVLGSEAVDKLLPGKIDFIKYVGRKARTREEAAALYFFMLSHFLADMCMPCHCDGRKLSSYGGGIPEKQHKNKRPLHKTWEHHWAAKVGPYFEKENLLKSSGAPKPATVLKRARAVDAAVGLAFSPSVPPLARKTDVWLDCINVCRLSFAVASIAAPPGNYPYDDPKARATFDELFNGSTGQDLLRAMDRAVLHDAVLNTAMVWRHIWGGVSAKS